MIRKYIHYMGKAVCNENCKHGLGRDFSLLLILKEQIIHSIQRAPGSSPGNGDQISDLFLFTGNEL
jgi:hypothetical protein